ncbi:hypothetical protein Pla108_38490 [Botrimarina colliarenosi]|uniref:DUF1800 domain-containing protein n=1 Tax=Botrimarina colliarenosi TaxID=2528001 RepID=A0A5C6A470_9BACT|nr:DUF1800 domain-containing protein [Botrimarina colliarenosi]TWT94137.1 hypothetical protein Pla108_38490 [Botrimarina colliarenosi]
MNDSAPSDWRLYEPSDSAPWDLQRVVHLHRRAGFGADWETLQRDLGEGPEAAIDRLLKPQVDEGFERLAATIGDAATASGNPNRLKAWWVFRMLKSPDPLGERLTLLWHNHFATSNRKVDNLVWMREQNDLLRRYSRAPFGDLLRAVVKHPAMLTWLDADSNRKGRPNENLGRELMELFTLGAGAYTEADVRAAARALTGWTITRQAFACRESRHDDSELTILGQTSPLDGDGLLDLLLARPETARRVARRLCGLLMGEGAIDQEAIDSLAAGLQQNDLDIEWGVETILRSDAFFRKENLRTRVTSPAQHAVETLRSLRLCDSPPSTLLVAEWITRMGQDLFYPPNVGGWNEGRSWLSTRTLVARANYANALAEGVLWRSPAEVDLSAGLPPGEGPIVDRLALLLWGIGAPAVATDSKEAGELSPAAAIALVLSLSDSTLG